MANDDDVTWLSAAAAVEFLKGRYPTAHSAQDALVERAASNALVSHYSARAVYIGGELITHPSVVEPLTLRFWRDFKNTNRQSHVDWIAGDFAVIYRDDDDLVEVRLIGMSFDREGVKAIIGADASEAPGESRKRGRPKGTHWERAWADIAIQALKGELRASALADVERALMGWGVENDIDISEATARRHATPYWDAHKAKAHK